MRPRLQHLRQPRGVKSSETTSSQYHVSRGFACHNLIIGLYTMPRG